MKGEKKFPKIFVVFAKNIEKSDENAFYLFLTGIILLQVH